MSNQPSVELLQELNSGSLLDKIDVALKHTVQGLLIRDKTKGEITLKLKFERINDTDWVNIAHALVYQKPTLDGKLSESMEGETMMHMHLNGQLSINAPEKGDAAGNPVAKLTRKA